MVKRYLLTFAAVLLAGAALLRGAPLHAQTAPAAATQPSMPASASSPAPKPPADPPASLADAFAEAAPPDPGQIVVTVSGQSVTPPDGAAPLGKSPEFPQIAASFGRILANYGDVTAVAPATMTVLNTAPGEPDIYANLPTGDALPLLIASLTDSQWSAAIGPDGLALAELNTDWQKKLLGSLLSKNSTLIVAPHLRAREDYSDADRLDKPPPPCCRSAA